MTTDKGAKAPSTLEIPQHLIDAAVAKYKARFERAVAENGRNVIKLNDAREAIRRLEAEKMTILEMHAESVTAAFARIQELEAALAKKEPA